MDYVKEMHLIDYSGLDVQRDQNDIPDKELRIMNHVLLTAAKKQLSDLVDKNKAIAFAKLNKIALY